MNFEIQKKYFAAISIVFKLGSINVAAIALSTYGLLFGIINIMKVYEYILSGQDLKYNIMQAQESLENLIMENYETMTQLEIVDSKRVLRTLRSNQTLKPNKYFDLHKPALMSTCAAIVTYAIILLQFKQVGF